MMVPAQWRGQDANKGGEWNDRSCASQPRPYVCEAATAPLAPPKTASATTSVGVQQVHLTTYGETCSTAHRQRLMHAKRRSPAIWCSSSASRSVASSRRSTAVTAWRQPPVL